MRDGIYTQHNIPSGYVAIRQERTISVVFFPDSRMVIKIDGSLLEVSPVTLVSGKKKRQCEAMLHKLFKKTNKIRRK